jgi:hypothetical protein
MPIVRDPVGIEWEMSIAQFVDVSYLRSLGQVFDELHEQVLETCRQIGQKKVELYALETLKRDLFARQLLADRCAYRLGFESEILKEKFDMVYIPKSDEEFDIEKALEHISPKYLPFAEKLIGERKAAMKTEIRMVFKRGWKWRDTDDPVVFDAEFFELELGFKGDLRMYRIALSKDYIATETLVQHYNKLVKDPQFKALV